MDTIKISSISGSYNSSAWALSIYLGYRHYRSGLHNKSGQSVLPLPAIISASSWLAHREREGEPEGRGEEERKKGWLLDKFLGKTVKRRNTNKKPNLAATDDYFVERESTRWQRFREENWTTKAVVASGNVCIFEMIISQKISCGKYFGGQERLIFVSQDI